jgi:hypothetical protein
MRVVVPRRTLARLHAPALAPQIAVSSHCQDAPPWPFFFRLVKLVHGYYTRAQGSTLPSPAAWPHSQSGRAVPRPADAAALRPLRLWLSVLVYRSLVSHRAASGGKMETACGPACIPAPLENHSPDVPCGP